MIPGDVNSFVNCESALILHVLVGGLEHGFNDFPSIGNVIIPTDFHIFQRG